MTTFEIERRLRLPAPDEPTRLPALVLPLDGEAMGAVRGRIGAGRTGRTIGGLSPRLAMAVLLLVGALVGAIATGALRLDRLPNPFDPNALFGGDGITIDYPKEWTRLTPSDPFNGSGASTVLLVSSLGVDGCSTDEVGVETPPAAVPSGDVYVFPDDDQTGKIFATEDRILDCVIRRPMADGEIRVTVTQGMPQAIAIGPIGDFDPELFFDGNNPEFGFYLPTEDDGWTETIDGMPAKLVVSPTSVTPGAEEVRTWIVIAPGGNPGPWYVQLALRGPDLAELRTQADGIARSLRFDHHPPALDEATRDAGLARALDRLDRETRLWRGSDLFGCFPREPGSAQATIDDILSEGWPGGRLAEPLPVTCTTSVEATPFGLWHATFVLSWEAGDGWPAGAWGWYTGFDGDGNEGGSSGQLFSPEGFVSPGNVGDVPPPLEGPLDIPIGSIVEVVPPGIPQTDGPIQAMFQDPHPTIGDRVVLDALPGDRYGIIAGPLAHAGYDWYQVEVQHGASYPAEYLWIPSTDGVRPLVRVVEPACPDGGSTAVVDLIYLQPLERVACFGDRDLVLDPAIAVRAVDEGGWGAIEGSPEWLAPYSLWRLYGTGGPDGLDGALPFAIDPSLGDTIPTGTWLTVTGHFDDAAAATCERTVPEGWGPVGGDNELARLHCRELFVVTGVEARDAP
ncbi:MAG TPA: hypothetical protein VFX65_11355 [Candidatus Limnocylindrales bacterium]|nr:hypothetical protein [Candidatus Limnocylindrales bacterium]